MAIADAPTRHTGPLTYADLPTEPDDGLRYELIDGALIVTPSTNTAEHYWVIDLDTPSVTAWRRDDEQEPAAIVTGDDVFSVDDPLPVSFIVSSIIRSPA